MNIISTTNFRDNLGNYVDDLLLGNSRGFVIGRYEKPEAVVILTDVTNLAIYGGSFDFLNNEPDLYSAKDTLEWKRKNKTIKK